MEYSQQQQQQHQPVTSLTQLPPSSQQQQQQQQQSSTNQQQLHQPSLLVISTTNIPGVTDVSAQSQQQAQAQLRMKVLSKKLLGSKKASKLFRLGVQQLVMSQPEYFLMASKRLIGLGQYKKAFQSLQKQLANIDSFRADIQPIIMHHFLHICHKLLLKFIRANERSIEVEKERQQSSHNHTASVTKPNKRSGFSLLERINALITIQTQNLLTTETLLLSLSNASKSASKNSKGTLPATMHNQSNQFTDKSDNLDAPPPESIDSWKIEMFSESFLYYFFATVKIGFKHTRTQGNQKSALFLLQKGTTFIESFVDPMFGDFKSMEVYHLAADLLQMKANVYFEAQNTTSARTYYEKAFKYYHFAGQLALKELQSTSANNVNNRLELKVENTFSSLSLNLVMIAASYDQEFKYARAREALNTSNWINSKILQYDYTSKLRNHVTDHLEEAEAKYRVFLEEKGEIRRVFLKALPHLEQLEAQASEKRDPQIEMIDRFNSYLYDKADTAQLNRTLLLIHGSRGSTSSDQVGTATTANAEPNMESERQNQILRHLRASGASTSTNDNNDAITVLVNGNREEATAAATLTNGAVASGGHQQRRLASSPQPYNPHLHSERAKETFPVGAGGDLMSHQQQQQSFSDYFNMHADGPTAHSSTFQSNPHHQSSHHQNSTFSKILLSTQTPSKHLNQTAPLPMMQSPSSQLYPPHNSTYHTAHKQNGNNGKQHYYQHEQSDFIKVQQNTSTNEQIDASHSILNSPTHSTFRSFATPTAATATNRQHDYLTNFSSARNNNNNIHNSNSKHSLVNIHPSATTTTNAGRSQRHNNERGQKQQTLGQSVSTGSGIGASTGAGTAGQQGQQSRLKLQQIKPKMLTTNKYFQPDLKPVSEQPLVDYKSLTTACTAQEQKYHYLNLQPTRAKADKNQGVISLDYAMENLIKEKIIQTDLSLMQRQYQEQDSYARSKANQRIINGSNSNHNNNNTFMMNNSLMPLTNSTILLQEDNSGILGTSVAAATEQQSQQPIKISNFALDKHVGEQIRNLMNSLNIPAQNQREIIDDLAAKFQAEKRANFIASASKSKMSSQGWTTEKILNELMHSINILGENVNTYNQRFAQFLSTIKEEDFDKSEFHTCLRKLIFRKKMGNGIIPQFFSERQQPIRVIQELLEIDNEYIVVQSGGERLNELMSDHKVIKNYFEEVNSASEPSTSDDVSTKKDIDNPKHSLEDEEDERSTKHRNYKQKQKRIQSAKTGAYSDSSTFMSSDSNMEKQSTMQFGQRNPNENHYYFQKSQETLRQMVIASEQEGEDMQKEIRHPRRRTGHNKVNKKQRTLGFTNYSNDLAQSVVPFTHRMRLQKAQGKVEGIDIMKMQNKWRATAAANSKGLNIGSQHLLNETPISSKLAQTNMVNKSSPFSFKEHK